MQFFWKDHLFRTFGKRKYGFSCSVKNNSGMIDMMMSAYDGDEIYELVGIFIPYQLSRRYTKETNVYSEMTA